MRIAVISTNEDSSPKILRASLKTMLEKENIDVVEVDSTDFLSRLFPLFGSQKKLGALHFRLRRKLENLFSDQAYFRKLQDVDAIVFSSQSPNGFWRNEYGIEKLKKMFQVPIVFHEVYYLGNAPSQIEKLKESGDFGINRYDWHLAVSQITETYTQEKPPWSAVGLNLEETDLDIPANKKLQAIVDFPQPGYEEERKRIIDALKNTGFPYIELTERISMAEIREIYKNSAIFFLSFPEAFGVPIAEC
jgi:hypothetical protein